MSEWFTGGLYDPSLAWGGSHTWTVSTPGVGGIHHKTYTPIIDKSSFLVDIPSMYPSDILDSEILKNLELEGPNMRTDMYNDPHSLGRRYVVACSHPSDLTPEHILKSISAMKGKLMLQCAPVKVDNIVCKMTPAVKHNIIMAYKRLEMYGKKIPFVARFDDYGRRLPDEVNIETMRGMTIKIVDPTDYGTYHIEFEGMVQDLFTRSYTTYAEEDVPF